MRALKVLVVDDSATVRQALCGILAGIPGFAVTTAADPLFALAKMERERPDVIVTDLEMPRMDGLAFLRQVMAVDPIPVIVCSAATGRGTQAAVKALELGAVGIVTKPRLAIRQFLEESAVTLVDAIRGAAGARLAAPRGRARGAVAAGTRPSSATPRAPHVLDTRQVLALGASTGGTEALRFVLEAMPPGCPGLVIVQHMPEGFTRAFAQRLDELCAIEVKEASEGDRVVAGRALIAPGNRHLLLQRSGEGYIVRLESGPLVSRHRPSVDVLFGSVARAAGGRAVGALFTGMGRDGAEGLAKMRSAGAVTLAQDEASCVVFGMPKEAIALGAVDEVVSLGEMPARLLARARQV